MQIVNLKASNVLRLSAVDITPAGNVVTLGGDNGAGKSSVLNAIQIALGGKRSMPARPIRDGEARAEVVVDLGEIVVRRVITAKSDQLTVESADGARYPKPQAMLDQLFTSISFDPLRFATEKGDRQAEILRDLLGLDLSDLDARRREVFDSRTNINRDGKSLRARIDAMQPIHEGAPAEEVAMADAVARLDDARDARARRDEGVAQLDMGRGRVRAARHDVDRLRAELEAAECALADAESGLRDLEASVGAMPSLADLEAAEAAARAELSGIETTNRTVRENQTRASAEADLTQLRQRSQSLTDDLASIDRERERRIASAPFPVDGLGFDDDGVTFRGLPFSQASAAERMRVSVAVGVAMNPKLRVFLVRDGSLLDARSLRLLHELAAQSACQLWLEDARTQDPSAIIIEDGAVAGATPAADAAPRARKENER